MLRHINHLTQQWAPLRLLLRNRRLDNEMSQAELAFQANLGGIATVGRIERGETTPGVDTVLAMADALELRLALIEQCDARLLTLDHVEIAALVRAAEVAVADPMTLPTTLRAKAQAALVKIQVGG